MPQNILPEYDIIIIGGGVAGLAIANALKKTNLSILLLERKPKYVDVNRGDTLYPHSIDMLEKWGVLDSILSKGPIKSNNARSRKYHFKIIRNRTCKLTNYCKWNF